MQGQGRIRQAPDQDRGRPQARDRPRHEEGAALRTARAILASLSLWAATSPAEVSVKDTTVSGIPSVRFLAGPGLPGDLKIAEERGVLRASLEGSSDSVLVVYDRNPFAQMMGRTRPLVFPPRVTRTRLILPKSTTLSLLGRLGLDPRHIPVPPPPASVTESVKHRDTVARSRVSETPDVPPPPPPLAPQVSDAPPDTSAVDDASDRDDSLAPSPPPAAEPRADRKKPFTVVIDAGHGGKDPGAIGKIGDLDAFEKTATLQVARKLRDDLADLPGVKVVMTRDKDVFLELSERTRLANAAKGDLFISLHCNSLPLNSKRREEVGGFMVYLLREAKDENDRAIERRENEAIRYETGERAKKQSLGPVEWMMLEHQLNLYTKESERFAGLVVRNLSKEGPVEKERTGAGQAGFFVLVGALMPSVLIEMGYLSNTDDATALMDPARQARIASGIARSIEEFRRTRR